MSYSKTHCFICKSELRYVIPGSKICSGNYSINDFHYYVNSDTGTIRYKFDDSPYRIVTFFDKTKRNGFYHAHKNKIIFEVDGQIPPLFSSKEIELFIQNYNILK